MNSKIASSIEDAKFRRKPSGFDFAFADSIHFVREKDWDVIASAQSIFFSREVLSVIERQGIEDIRFRYGIVYQTGTPVALIVTQHLTVDASKLTGRQLKDVPEDDGTALKLKARDLREKALKAVRRRLIVCGNLLSWGPHGIAMADNVDQSAVWVAVAEALYRIRRADRLHGQTDYVIIKDLPVDTPCTPTPLKRFRYRPHETEPDMVLDVPNSWQSIEDYLESLKTKYRKSVRRTLKEVEKAKLTVERMHDLSDDAADIHSLYKAVYARASVRLVTLSESYLPDLASCLGPERFACTMIRDGKQLVGFVTTLKDGDTAIGYFLGMDYSYNESAPVYLRLLLAVIEEAIRLGCRRVSFGRTALEPKSRLGCRPAEVAVWIRHRIPVLNLIVQQILKSVPHDEPPKRSPFRAK